MDDSFNSVCAISGRWVGDYNICTLIEKIPVSSRPRTRDRYISWPELNLLSYRHAEDSSPNNLMKQDDNFEVT